MAALVVGMGPTPLQLRKAVLSRWLLAWVQEEEDSLPLGELATNNLTKLQ